MFDAIVPFRSGISSSKSRFKAAVLGPAPVCNGRACECASAHWKHRAYTRQSSLSTSGALTMESEPREPTLPSALPLPQLAVPTGDTLKFRKRDNALNEVEEEALRVQLRQHLGASTLNNADGSARRHRRRGRRRPHQPFHHERLDGDSDDDDMASLTGRSQDDSPPSSSSGTTTDPFDLAALGARLLAPHRRKRVSDLFKIVQRLLWVSDEDMDEELNENDPKVVAGKRFLKGVEALALLTDKEFAQLAALSELRVFHNGDIAVDDEREADGLYIILTGHAARLVLTTDGIVDEDATIRETLAYQDHFGTVISPTEAAALRDGSVAPTVVVATSDVLECVWIPEVAIRMLNVQPRMDFEFVLVLHNPRRRCDRVQRAQEDVLRRLLRAGLHVTVLANTRNTTQCIILLLSAPLWLLAREDKLLAVERLAEAHAAAEDDAPYASSSTKPRASSMPPSSRDADVAHGEMLSASERIEAFASLLTRSASDQPPGVGLRGVENNQDIVVRDVFPLHDPSMTDFILSTWFKETHSATTKRLFLLRVKDYFGLRVAFFLAFVRLYNAALVYPMNAGVALWVFWRWIHYRTYVKALGVYGLLVACVWAPAFLKRWLRYQNSLLVEWNLLGPQTTTTAAAQDSAQPNPEFRDFAVETINVARDGDAPDYVEVRTYDPRRRWPKYAIFALFCVVCLVLLFVFVGAYVQWYIIAVMTPTCTDPRCPAFLDVPGGCEAHCHELFAQGKTFLFMRHISSCATYCDTRLFDRSYYRCDDPFTGCFATERGILGTARWFYVLVQGIVLGLTLDIVFLAVFEAIAAFFNRWENYATEPEQERRLIEKVFLFNWVGYFYWFFLLAFLYVPNGARVQQFIRDHVDQNWVVTLDGSVRFSRYWVDGLISMDAAFVTPMIVTQALNLVINTFVPYLLRRAIVRARDSYHVKKDRLASALRKTTTTMTASSKDDKATAATAAAVTASSAVNATEADSDDDAEDDGETGADDTTAWFSPADLATLSSADVAAALAERAPVTAERLEDALWTLLGAVSSHDEHMQRIAAGIARDELDSYQRTSFDWLDDMTRRLEEDESGKTSAATSSGNSGTLTGGDDDGNGDADGDGTSTVRPRMQAAAAAALRRPIRGLWGDDKQPGRLRFITQWQCRHYLYTADRVMEESSMPVYSPFSDLLHLAIQFSYTIMFSVVWPFCCLCSWARNVVAVRFDAIKMSIDCKRPVPRRTVGIGAWWGAFLFEVLVGLVVVPGLFVYVSGQLDAFFPHCEISATRYGPAERCLEPSQRLAAFCSLENVGILLAFVVYLKKSDISHETSVKIVEQSRKRRHHLRRRVRVIGETILVAVPPKPTRQDTSTTGGSNSSATTTTAPGRRPTLDASLPPSTAVASSTLGSSRFTDASSLFVVDLQSFSSSPSVSPAPSPPPPPPQRPSLTRRWTSLSSSSSTASTGSSLDATSAALSAAETAARTPVEWREGTVSWVKAGQIKVNFSHGRQLRGHRSGGTNGSQASELSLHDHDVWLTPTDRYAFVEPTPVRIFEVGASVLLASKKFGRWLEATITALDHRDRSGRELPYSPNELHVRVVEAQNLRTPATQHATLIDPYCVLSVTTRSTGRRRPIRHATSVKRSTRNPVWDESIVVALAESDLFDEQPLPPAEAASGAAESSRTTSLWQTLGGGGPAASTTSSTASSRHTSHAKMSIGAVFHDDVHICDAVSRRSGGAPVLDARQHVAASVDAIIGGVVGVVVANALPADAQVLGAQQRSAGDGRESRRARHRPEPVPRRPAAPRARAAVAQAPHLDARGDRERDAAAGAGRRVPDAGAAAPAAGAAVDRHAPADACGRAREGPEHGPRALEAVLRDTPVLWDPDRADPQRRVHGYITILLFQWVADGQRGSVHGWLRTDRTIHN
ncbi:hypothetical protein PINS_up011118 [Pythium insidiosum]|nr:hypothetical protein PINS_up011118 [Pythium insidiosum]